MQISKIIKLILASKLQNIYDNLSSLVHVRCSLTTKIRRTMHIL